MNDNAFPRREFLAKVSLAAGAAVAAVQSPAAQGKPLHLATNVYPWLVFYRRENRDFQSSLAEGLGEIAACNLDGYEPIVENPKQLSELLPLLKQHRLELRSFYVNSTLHDRAGVEQSLASILAVADPAQKAGTRIIVTNPSPIKWGGSQNKTDEQLRTQADALNRLGEKLAKLGLTLAYHNHDPELREAAREFHHMMVGTDPRYVTLCLDAHWIYRGSGNSSVALFDIVKLYGSRITELHLRQSVKGIWTETFGEGDIDYTALALELKRLKLQPHLVLEQAVESGSPRTMSAAEAHRKSAEYARRLFAGFA